MWKILILSCGAACGILFSAGAAVNGGNVRKLHFVQDDAQDYMVSKIYSLKYAQANDLIPFVSGIVMRYNINSVVNSIEYGNNQQLLTVTCPEKLIPYVDDFVAKADREVKIHGKVLGEIIQGTGITRAVYRPLYRSGEDIVNVMIQSVIGEGPAGAVYAYDANSNQIYWKDNASNTSYIYQFLGFLDRPAPQVTIEFTIFEVRESTLRDLGIEYLAWKNGPGLNIFQTGFSAFGLSSAGSAALQAATGPVGGFFCAPQFDASFIRMLQQDGKAEITATATLTVANSNTAEYSVFFNPAQQNIVKQNNDQTKVSESILTGEEGVYHNYAKITGPIVNIHYGIPQSPYPSSEAFEVAPYTPGSVSGYPGTLFFAYDLQSAAVVERNNVGAELAEVTNINGNILIPLNKEVILGRWEKVSEVEQVIGVPWLSDIPVLRYFFSTVTSVKEKTRVYVAVNARLFNAAKPGKLENGKLMQLK
ncbi:MAG: hypothetical protein E7058_07105 [Lentisphaerae bacterium]|nr:hypothetical protein [Lentisphaerota bacterium]